MPHKTLTDIEGNKYTIVASWWMKALTIVAIVNFLILMIIVAVLIDNYRDIDTTLKVTDKTQQRNQALGDIAASRAVANKWAFEKTCELVIKSLGQPCMENPIWYADPAKYPLIATDPAGAGLFPPKENK